MIEYIIVPKKKSHPKGYYMQTRLNWLFLKFVTGAELNYLYLPEQPIECNRIFVQGKQEVLNSKFLEF
jgi:hypothetical protein